MSVPKTILLGSSGSFVGGSASLFRVTPLIHLVWTLFLETGGAPFILRMAKRFRHGTAA